MSKDHSERRMYRKSPGRQYGYDYDPLRSRSDGNHASQKSHRGSTASHSGSVLSQRPDPRRTRQLLRKSIIASKQRSGEYSDDYAYEVQSHSSHGRMTRRLAPMEYEEDEKYKEDEKYREYEEYKEPVAQRYHDDDEGYIDDYLDGEHDSLSTEVDPPVARVSRHLEEPRATRRLAEPRETRRLAEPLADEDVSAASRAYPPEDSDYEYDYEYEEDRSSVERSNKKKLTRRGLLFGAGALAAAGAGIALVETAPKLPQAANAVTGNVNQQVQDAFNRGVTQGANQARKDLIDSLSSLEGFTLDSAVTAARLTRVAYDVFVSPVVKFGSALTGDFLSGMLTAFKKAREWLAGVYQDNATLIAIQKVLEAWVDDVQKLPKQLDAITEADLDGAQSYLRALQRKIQDEQTALNKSATPQATSTAAAKTTPTPAPKK